jgi:hypothetical protein
MLEGGAPRPAGRDARVLLASDGRLMLEGRRAKHRRWRDTIAIKLVLIV